MCIPTRTHLTYNDDKPWFTAKLRQLRRAKENSHRKGDKILYKQAKYTLDKEIRVAKRDYSTEIYCRFEKTPHTPAIQISEDEVCQVFRKQKRKKSPGPDCVTPVYMKSCADQLAPIFAKIFNRSLELCEVPSCFKHSTIIPIPKKSKITGLNYYRLVALTSVVIKSFEKLVLAHLKDITGPSLDPLQFAYRANRSVDDAVNMGLHYVLQHLDRPGTYVRILFVDFSSAFNTIIPNRLLSKITLLSISTSVCQWINSFLTRQAAASEAGKILIQHLYNQHWSSLGLHSFPTALLPVHQRLHI